MTIILPFRRIVLESPYRATETATVEQHQVYLSHCLTDCRSRSETPFASHFGLMGADDDELERQIAIRAAWEWGDLAAACVIYSDFGVTPGMCLSIDHYSAMGKPIEWRKLDVKLVKSILDM